MTDKKIYYAPYFSTDPLPGGHEIVSANDWRTAQAELAALREELAAEKSRSDREMDLADEESAALREAIRDLKDWREHSQSLSAFASIIARAEAVTPVPGPLRKSLTAAEQRNAELVELLRDIKSSHGVLLMTSPPQDPWLNNRIDGRISAALKPNESGDAQ